MQFIIWKGPRLLRGTLVSSSYDFFSFLFFFPPPVLFLGLQPGVTFINLWFRTVLSMDLLRGSYSHFIISEVCSQFWETLVRWGSTEYILFHSILLFSNNSFLFVGFFRKIEQWAIKSVRVFYPLAFKRWGAPALLFTYWKYSTFEFNIQIFGF